MIKEEIKSLSFKEKTELIDAVFSILLSIIALWGTLSAWQNGFFHKIKYLAEHYHQKIVAEEQIIKKDL